MCTALPPLHKSDDHHNYFAAETARASFVTTIQAVKIEIRASNESVIYC